MIQIVLGGVEKLKLRFQYSSAGGGGFHFHISDCFLESVGGKLKICLNLFRWKNCCTI